MATAKLFQSGGSQAVRLPKQFRFPGKEVDIKRTSRGVLLVPILSQEEKRQLFVSLAGSATDFPVTAEQPPIRTPRGARRPKA